MSGRAILRNCLIMTHPTVTKYKEIARSKSREKKNMRLISQMRSEIDKLKRDAHPPIPLDCFDGYRELEARVTRLEKYTFQGLKDED